MRNYPSDVSVSNNCFDANLEMVERRYPDKFPATGIVRVDNTVLPRSNDHVYICLFVNIAIKT